jgi:hypothetical protein
VLNTLVRFIFSSYLEWLRAHRAYGDLVRGQPRGRVFLKWKPFGVNLLATARTSRSHVSSAIFWASITSPIGKAPIGMQSLLQATSFADLAHVHGVDPVPLSAVASDDLKVPPSAELLQLARRQSFSQ